MLTSRRRLLRMIGGSGALLGASAVGLTQCDTMPSSAIAPWTEPGHDRQDVRERALAHALLAPNPHNLQPWIADLRDKDAITLLWDASRTLPETDPYGRQILIGFGTFIELLDIALRQRGYRADITLLPEGMPGPDADVSALPAQPVARIKIAKDKTISPDPLFNAIPARRSCKEPYDLDKPLLPSHEADLRASHIDTTISLNIAKDGPLPDRLRNLTRDAMALEMQTPRMLKESIDLTRVGAEEIAVNPDGIDLHGPMFWWLKRFGIMTRDKAMQPGTMAYQGGIDYALGWAGATPSFGWIATEGNSRAQQIAAGRAYVRLNLRATAQGVAMHPVSQLLQEYPEMSELQQQFRTAVGAKPGTTIQMLFRLGYADQSAPSPRRPLDSIIRT